jgi:hypothetical protein
MLFNALCNLCALCVSVVNHNVPYFQLKTDISEFVRERAKGTFALLLHVRSEARSGLCGKAAVGEGHGGLAFNL